MLSNKVTFLIKPLILLAEVYFRIDVGAIANCLQQWELAGLGFEHLTFPLHKSRALTTLISKRYFWFTLAALGQIQVKWYTASLWSNSHAATNLLILTWKLMLSLLQVDERGSVAAAATTIRLQMRSLSQRPRFVADHPFLWCIMHEPTSHIIFMGRLAKPSGELVSIDHDEL